MSICKWLCKQRFGPVQITQLIQVSNFLSIPTTPLCLSLLPSFFYMPLSSQYSSHLVPRYPTSVFYLHCWFAWTSTGYDFLLCIFIPPQPFHSLLEKKYRVRVPWGGLYMDQQGIHIEIMRGRSSMCTEKQNKTKTWYLLSSYQGMTHLESLYHLPSFPHF